jgi:hypothetical protein
MASCACSSSSDHPDRRRRKISMTATNLEQPTPVVSPHLTVRVLIGVLVAVLLLVTFVAGRVSAPDAPQATPTHAVAPAAVHAADADIPCRLYQPC